MKIWITSAEIQLLMGCKKTKAAGFIKRCNALVLKNRPDSILPGRGKTYLKAFCQLTGTTKEEVLEVLNAK